MAQLWRTRTVMTGETGAPYYSIQHWIKTPGWEATSVRDRVETFWDDMKGLLTTALTIEMDAVMDVIDVATGSLVGIETVDVQTITGTNDAAVLPYSSQALGQFRTGEYVSGRELRGRINIPGLCADSLSAGTFYAPNRGDTATRLEEFAGPTITHALAVYSTTHHVAAPVGAVSVNAQFAVLRSRRD